MFWAVPPTDTVTQGVVLMSHYDSVPAGPGAGDDGAGVAVGLEVARLLKGRDLPPACAGPDHGRRRNWSIGRRELCANRPAGDPDRVGRQCRGTRRHRSRLHVPNLPP